MEFVLSIRKVTWDYCDTTADAVWCGLKVSILTHHSHPKELVDSRNSSPMSHVTLP